MSEKSIPVIAIDGPSGSGKGTISGMIAQKLGWHMLDSGALYRLIALAAQWHSISVDAEGGLARLAAQLDVEFQTSEVGDLKIFLEGQEVTDLIRTEECGRLASKVATIAKVRQALLERQRAFMQLPGLVADGRDMGSVVFPNAPLKIFLTASPQERAKRRYKQLKQKGIDVNFSEILTDIAERDQRDSQRDASPMKPTADAIVLDTSNLSINEVVEQVLGLYRSYVKVS